MKSIKVSKLENKKPKRRRNIQLYGFNLNNNNSMTQYIAALGMFRILHEQKDNTIKIRWNSIKHTVSINTILTKDEIRDFFLDKYIPNVFLMPWSYNKYKKTLRILNNIPKQRVQNYKKTIGEINNVISLFKKIEDIKVFNKDSITKENKPLFLKLYRNMIIDDAVIFWFDAIFGINNNRINFSPLFLTGGNSGNFDFSEHFMQRLAIILDPNKREESTRHLNNLLFDTSYVSLKNIATVCHNAEGVSSSLGGDIINKKTSIDNIWEYILFMEGTYFFTGSNVKKYSNRNTNMDISAKTAWSFTVPASNVGYGTATKKEISNGEIWLPLWYGFSSYNTIQFVFNEGRIARNNHQAETSIDVVKSLLTKYGVELGIVGFLRYGIFERRGQLHLTSYLGQMFLHNDINVHLLDDLNKWLKTIKKWNRDSADASNKLDELITQVDESIINYCMNAGRNRDRLQNVIINVSQLEFYVRAYTKIKFNHMLVLKPQWLTTCYDGSAEYRIAMAVSSIHGSSQKDTYGIKYNIYNISKDDASLAHVWHMNSPVLVNLSNVLYRRYIDENKQHHNNTVSINSFIPCRNSDIHEFLNSRLNEDKINRLIPALTLIKHYHGMSYPERNRNNNDRDVITAGLPEVFNTIKNIIVNPINKDDINYNSVCNNNILQLLLNNDIDEAYIQAQKMNYKNNDIINKHVYYPDIIKNHIMPGLLLPSSSR